MRVATIGGLRVHWQEDGDPGGVPVVFANSLGTDLRVWDALLPLLPPGLRIIRYDLRGHGLTDAPEGEYYMGDLVGDVAGLIDQLRLGPVIFVGLSIGGVIAQGLAAERPDLVRAAVLSNTAAKIGTEASWRERIAAIRSGGIASIADSILEKWFPRRYRIAEPEQLAIWRNMLTRTPVGAMSAAARPWPRPTCATRRPRCGCRSWRSPARSMARPRPTWCARPPRASRAASSRSSAIPAISLASTPRACWPRSLRSS